MVSKIERDYMNPLEEARALNAGRAGKAFILSVLALLIFFIAWASFSEIDELTRGSGQVVPSQEMQIIQSLEGGVLQELLVKEGDRVEVGQVLLKISDIAYSAEAKGGEAKLFALQLKQQRLIAEANETDFNVTADVEVKNEALVENEIRLYQSRQEELKNTISIFEDRRKKSEAELAENQVVISTETKNVKLLKEEVRAAEKMVASRAMSKLELVRLKRSLNDAEGRLNEAKENAKGLKASVNGLNLEAKQKQDMFRTKALSELGDVKTQIISLEESLKSIGDVVDRSALRSPVTGIVNAISVKTKGGVIEPARPLVEIVPLDDELIVNARVSPNDIAFIEMGQPVKVRISAYDSQRYGGLDGEVIRIGASTVSDGEGNVHFEVEVRTAKNYIGTEEKPLPIAPGMLADIDIMTGRKTIMAYLLKPVLRLKDRAFRER